MADSEGVPVAQSGQDDAYSARRASPSLTGRELKRQKSRCFSALSLHDEINAASCHLVVGRKAARKSTKSTRADSCLDTGTTQSLPPPAIPTLTAEQAYPIASSDRDSKRLVVVLSNASLETYKSSHPSRGGPKGGEDKYALLNSDEHIGIMRKMNRDISEGNRFVSIWYSLLMRPKLALISPISKSFTVHTSRSVLTSLGAFSACSIHQ